MNKSNHHRTVRSFVRRQGRVSDSRRSVLKTLWPKYGITVSDDFFDFAAIFGRIAPVVMEIGFGMGHALIEMAQQNPQINYMGVEVHKPGIAALLAELEELNIQNVRVLEADAQQILMHHISDNSLAAILIYFPDPWPKKRHHKRRLIQHRFVNLLCTKLSAKGYIHFATDWQEYAEQALEIFTHTSELKNRSALGTYMERPRARPLTKFEKRGQQLGHQIYDLIFEKIV